MMLHKSLSLVFMLALIFETAYSTEFLLNALKQHVPKIRCKLHKIGSKIIPHSHSHGEPCENEGLDNHNHPQESGQFNGENTHNNGYGFEHSNGYSNKLDPPSTPKPFVPEQNYNVDPYRPENGHQGQNFNNFPENSLDGTNSNHGQTTENVDDTFTTKKSKNDGFYGPQSSTESYPTSLDIDIRFNAERQSTTLRSAPTSYATVPTEGGRNIVKAPCKPGWVMTVDGCMEEI